MDISIIFKAIILGIIEGLTEFLPISSTAHLIIAAKIINFNEIENNIFEIAIQLGAILAVVFLYRNKIIKIINTLPNNKDSQQFTLNIICAFIPTAIIGFLLYPIIKTHFFSLKIIAISLIIGGIIILIIEKAKITIKFNKIEEINIKNSILLGLLQSLAIIPGTSRSGATIMGGLILGMRREVATEMSFFLAIPTIFAATIYDLYKNYDLLNIDHLFIISVGFISAFISSIIIIRWFINFISKNDFKIFAYYRIIIGLILGIYIYV
ncbi:undecaprenyl-diphosphate phosphatase [Rickettsiales bacterium]|nr:undecaprenyl-diphosphate phosphatase [Rickettsiales bacterium]MDB2550499.1 undecaprenyl-diphosphate phosphatase [Rickettsiales bacterium]